MYFKDPSYIVLTRHFTIVGINLVINYASKGFTMLPLEYVRRLRRNIIAA